MPNHIHGILILSSNVEAGYIPSLQQNVHSLGDVVGKFKASVSRQIRKKGHNSFQWQSRFYDRIIRNEDELFQIRKYIDLNPLKKDLTDL